MVKAKKQSAFVLEIIKSILIFSLITAVLILVCALLMKQRLLEPEWAGTIGTITAAGAAFISTLMIKNGAEQKTGLAGVLHAAIWSLWLLLLNLLLFRSLSSRGETELICIAGGCVMPYLIKNPSNSTKKSYAKMKQKHHI